MAVDKSIIIGCDDTKVLSQIQLTVDQIRGYNLNTISITNEHNFFGVARSIEPALVILCFRNNYKLLRELASLSQEKNVPILCYNRYIDSKALTEFSNGIIFPYEFHHISKPGYLRSGIKSILRMLKSNSKNINHTPTVDIEVNNSNQLRTRTASRYVLELEQKVEMLFKVKSRIKMLNSNVNDTVKSELNSIVKLIDSSIMDKNIWADFKLYFEEINPEFLANISQQHPDLTPIDLKYCCYLKMNMSNNDICKLLGINQDSVRTHKYRLKKKLVLPKERDLHNYVMSVI